MEAREGDLPYGRTATSEKKISGVRKFTGHPPTNLMYFESRHPHLRLAEVGLRTDDGLGHDYHPHRHGQDAIADGYPEVDDALPLGCLVLDHEGRVVRMNRACEALLGGGLLYQRFSQWVSSMDQDVWFQHLEMARQSGEREGCVLQLMRADGSVRHARMDCLHVEHEGEACVRVFLADITRSRSLEAEILGFRDKLAELHAMHVTAQTAATITHELNQPLLAITSYGDAAAQLLNGAKPDLALIRKAVDGCRREAFRAGRTMRELLELFKVEVAPPEVFDLNGEITAVLRDVRVQHELDFDHAVLLEEGLAPVRANRIHVQKVLLNLLQNAIEAMKGAGVEQPAIVVKVTARVDENVVQVTVQDNGPGLGEDDVQRLFQPFFTTKTQGTGMGLSVSRALIEENGGQLWADQQEVCQMCLYPQELKGAAFHFTLPLAK
jgi:signal transduction histidine kinase